MPSRTGPCTCGSGKQYKRCCGADGPGNPFSSANTVDILSMVAALTLLPENHGKNIRLEKIARRCVVQRNKSTKKIKPSDLQQYLRKNFAADAQEDLPGNLFTEVIAFHGGDYLVLPGITESPSFVLGNLLAAMYNWPETRLPDHFKSNTSHAVHALLVISDLMVRKAGGTRYMNGKYQEQHISFPANAKLQSLKEAVFFSDNELEQIFRQHHIAKECLTLFAADMDDPAFADKHIYESPFVGRPLLKVPGGMLVASPATLCYAMIEAIKSLSVEWDCVDALHEAYHALVWNAMKMNLQRLNFVPEAVPGVMLPEHDYVQTILTRFDDDKFCLIQYLALSQPGKTPDPKKMADERESIIKQIMAVKGYEQYQFMELVLISPIANDIMFGMIGNAHARSVFMNIYDLDIVTQSKKCSALALWKFAGAREEQVPREMKMLGLSFLDEYTAYKDHNDSFYFSDRGFDISQWMFGQSQSFIEKTKRLTDEHCMAIRENGRFAKTMVTRQDKYAPIYASLMDLAGKNLRFAVEGLGPSVWVEALVPRKADDAVSNIYWEMTQTIAYWLWQLTPDIKPLLTAMDPDVIYFPFEFDDNSRTASPDDSFKRDPNVFNKLKTNAVNDHIHLLIPHEIMPYFYGADNEGDRILVRQILYGISQALAKCGLASLTEEQITAIIESRAPLGHKKKLVLLHSRSNMLLDRSNIRSPRYIKDSDTSTIANKIVALLGDKCPPVGEVVGTDAKKKMTINIVVYALLPLLKKTIAQYDSELLLQRLLSLNESLINAREHQKIMTPTRIACFVSEETHTEDLMETISDLSRTIIAVRCLIEHIAAETSKGTKPISRDAIDELVAIMDAIISWGSVGDQLSFDLFDIRLGVLPTGRIATDKSVMREIFDPYNHAKTRETVQDALDSFEQEFPTDDHPREPGKDVPAFLDKAFVAEFSISFTRICEFIDILADLGFQQKTAYAKMDKNTLLQYAAKRNDPFTADEVNHALEFLGLTNRGDVKTIPKGYEGFDISPWRFNRRLSLLRKPVVIFNTHDPDNPVLYWGPRQVLQSRITIAEQCMHDRLKVTEKGPVKKAISRFAEHRGASLVLSVLDQFPMEDLIIDKEVFISSSGKLKNHDDIGDIDVLLIDPKDKILYCLECKSFAPSRNIKEMIEECEKLLGSRSQKGLIQKHANRHEWIKNNLKQMSVVYKMDLTGFTVKSCMITRENMLFPHLKVPGIDMPIIDLYELEKYGLALLKKLP